MNFYPWVVLLHILSATVMFGTSIANGMIRLYVNKRGEVWLIAAGSRLIMMLNRRLMLPSLILLPATGFWLALTATLPILSGWVSYGWIGTLLVWLLFLAGIHFEHRMEVSATADYESGAAQVSHDYRLADKWGLIIGVSAAFVITGVVYLMVFRG